MTHHYVIERKAPESASDAAGMRRTVSNLNALDETVSFVLGVVFDSKPKKLEIKLVRVMFSPSANIILIPRGRPELAYALDVDEFFDTEHTIFSSHCGWREILRVHEKSGDFDDQIRIRSNIELGAGSGDPKEQSIDVVFTMRSGFQTKRVQSCTIVYDERPHSRSPVTLY